MRTVDTLAAGRTLVLEDRRHNAATPREHAASGPANNDTARISQTGQSMLEAETRRLERQRAQVRGEERATAPTDEGLRAEAADAQRRERSAQSSEATDEEETQATEQTSDETADAGELAPDELEVLRKLQARDREVRSHEQAHQAVGGQYAGNAQYEYQQGPDHRRYAIGGEVPIDVGEESEPEQTIDKMRIVRRAALAPAEPSAADRRIASIAVNQLNQAQQELFAERMEEQRQAREEEATEATERQGETDDGQDDYGGPSNTQVAAVRGERIDAVA